MVADELRELCERELFGDDLDRLTRLGARPSTACAVVSLSARAAEQSHLLARTGSIRPITTMPRPFD